MTRTIETANGIYRVYRAEDAGAPELHEPGCWHFEPADYDGGDVWSFGHRDLSDAVEAASAEGETLAAEGHDRD